MPQSEILRNHESMNARSQLLFALQRGWRVMTEEVTDEYTVYAVYPTSAYSYEIRVAN